MKISNPASIAIVYLGGREKPFRSQGAFGRWMNGCAELRLVVQATAQFIGDAPSQLSPALFLKAVRGISRDWKRFDGWVVILPQESLQFGAALFAYVFGHIGKPVICIAPPLHIPPPVVKRMGGRQKQQKKVLKGPDADALLQQQVAAAAQAAVSDIAGVALLRGDTLLHPIKHTLLGSVHFGVQLHQRTPQRSSQNKLTVSLRAQSSKAQFQIEKAPKSRRLNPTVAAAKFWSFVLQGASARAAVAKMKEKLQIEL